MTKILTNRFIRGLAYSVLSPAALISVPAYAQNAGASSGDSAAGVEEVVVTGIRESLNAARDIKREATQFVDAIVADDIGKLPDRNVAESLARVSGVQVDRGIAEGTSVSVRGLRQNVYLFNGRQIVDPTGRGGVGLDTLGSSTYGLLSLVPSELISRLELTKLPSADQIAGALGGIVDVQTPMPLDGPERLGAKIGGTYYDQASQGGYEAFALASQKFAGDTLGLQVSASYNRRDLSQEGLDTFSGYSRFTQGGIVRFGNADARPEEIAETRKNLGLNAVLQWQPADGVELIADTFYSKLDSERDRWWLSFNPTVGLTNAQFSDDNILLSGTSVGPVLTNTEFLDTDADISSSALRGNFDVTERLRASAEVAYTKSTSTAHQLYFRLQPIVGINPTLNFDLTSGDLGSYQISGIDLSDPAQLRYTILFDNTYDVGSEDIAARTDWTYDLDAGFLKAASVGVRYDDLDSEQNPLRADIRPAGGIPATAMSRYLTLHSNPSFASGEFVGLPRSYLTGTLSSIGGCSGFTDIPAISQDVQCLHPRDNTNALSSTFEIKERFTEGYGKLDFDTTIGSAALSGNVGARYVHRELESIGNQIAPSGGATPSTFERTDSDVLPSAVAKLTLNEDLIFRLGAARVIAYPNTADLNSGVTLANNAVFVGGVQTVLGTGTGGAPDLDPFKADQVDLSAEYYFGGQALISLGLFYKDVSTFIIQKQSPETYGGVNYLVNRKVNGEGAEVQGVELLVQLPFYFLDGWADGFGVIASYSYIDSSTPIKDVAGRVLPLPGLSPNNANLVGYYEKGPISVRLAYNWRDDYLIGLSAAATGIYNSPYTDLSATLRYDVSSNVSLGFEANNILDEKQRTYDGVDEALRTNLFFGRIYKASVSLKF